MKKILGIMVLGLLWCNIGLVDDEKPIVYNSSVSVPEDARPNDDSVLIKVRTASKELAIEEAIKKCTEKHEERCYAHYASQAVFGQ